MGSSTACLASI